MITLGQTQTDNINQMIIITYSNAQTTELSGIWNFVNVITLISL